MIHRVSEGTESMVFKSKFCGKFSTVYRGDLKFDHSKSGNIWNPDFLRAEFQMVRFSNVWASAVAIAIKYSSKIQVFDSDSSRITRPTFSLVRTQILPEAASFWQIAKWGRVIRRILIAIVPTIWKPDHLKSRSFYLYFKWFWTKRLHFYGFQMVGLTDFRYHL